MIGASRVPIATTAMGRSLLSVLPETERTYLMDSMRERFPDRYPDVKAGIEKAGKLDRVAVAKALHGLKISAAKDPGVLMDVSIDDKGDLDRESFLVEVKDGRQVVKEVLPPLSAAAPAAAKR